MAGCASALQNTGSSEDARCRADGCHQFSLARKLLNHFVYRRMVEQMQCSRHSARQHDPVKCAIIHFFRYGVRQKGHAVGTGHFSFSVHRDHRNVHLRAAHNIHHGQSLNLLTSVCHKNSNFTHHNSPLFFAFTSAFTILRSARSKCCAFLAVGLSPYQKSTTLCKNVL